jgi:hypothetical protein
MKTITVKTFTYERKDIEKVYTLPDKPVFVESWNLREIIGIWPEPYDFTKNGGDRKGFEYHVRVAHKSVGDPTEFYSLTIRDWEMKEIAANPNNDSKYNAIKRKVMNILLEDQDYSRKISEEMFREYYANYLKDLNLIKNEKTKD